MDFFARQIVSTCMVTIVLATSMLAVPFRFSASLPQSQVTAGSVLPVVFKISPDKGWHFYWQNPGDSGVPPSVSWKLPAGWTGSEELKFPAPKVIGSSSEVTYGFASPTLLWTTVFVPKSARPGKSIVSGRISVMICRESCRVDQVEFRLPINVTKTSRASKSVSIFTDAKKKTTFPPLPVQAFSGSNGIQLKWKPAKELTKAYFFAFDDSAIRNVVDQPFQVSTSEATLTLQPSEFANEPIEKISGILQLTIGTRLVNYRVSSRVESNNPGEILGSGR